MTADTPAAPAKDETKVSAAVRCLRRYANGEPDSEIGSAEVEIILSALSSATTHVASLTAQLEAERAAHVSDVHILQMAEAEAMALVLSHEAKIERETARADAAVAEAKALREAVKSADALLGRILKHGEIAVLDVGSPFSTYGGKKPPSKEMWAVPRHMHAEIEELRATLAQPAAKETP